MTFANSANVPRPPVGQDQWERIRFPRPAMDEMDVDAVDRGLELLKLVEPAFLVPPIKLVAPIVDELLQVRLIGPEHPPHPVGLVGHTGARQSVLEIHQYGVGHVDGERFDLGDGRRLALGNELYRRPRRRPREVRKHTDPRGPQKPKRERDD